MEPLLQGVVSTSKQAEKKEIDFKQTNLVLHFELFTVVERLLRTAFFRFF